MERVTFRPGDIILLDGLYGCSAEECEHHVWGVSGRRLPELACGHGAEWRHVRPRPDPRF
jgi:hypothetical protein